MSILKLKKPKLFLSLLLVICINNVFATDKKVYLSDTGSVEILSRSISISTDGRNPFEVEHTSKVNEYNYETRFDNISYEKFSNITYIINENGERTFIILQDVGKKTLYLQHSSGWSFHGKMNGEHFGSWNFQPIKVLNKPSFLVEGDVKYSYTNLRRLLDSKPWVEGVDGYGIGEEIILSAKGVGFYLYNGFVSFNKPELFISNSRVRSIQVTVGNEIFMIDIPDSPNPIFIPTSDISQRSEVIIKILDVYEGRKYSDTCVNGIFFTTN